jgi:outer membrane protein
MKKIILSAIAVCAFGFANAQDKDSYGFAKGDMYLGGSISYLSEDNGGVKTTSNTIAPEFGYFISDNLALTAGLDLISSEDAAGDKTKETVIKIGGRYYFLNVGERFKTYTNFGLESGSNDNGGNGAEKTSTLGLGAGIGVNYWITSKWAVDFGLNDVFDYTSSKTGDVKSTKMSLDINNKYNNIFAAAKLGLIYKF